MKYQKYDEERPDPRAAPHFFKAARSNGDFTLNNAIILLFVMMLLVLGISVLGVVNDAMKLHSVAAELARYIELRGQVDSAVYTELDRLASVAGVDIESRDISGSFTAGTRLQFGATFTVNISTTTRFGIGGVLSLPVPLRSTVTGRSEQYWR